MSFRLSLAALLLPLLLAAPAIGGPQVPPVLPHLPAAEAVPAIYPADTFARVLNAYRSDHGRRELSASRSLAGAAQAHAEWLRARGTLSHTGRGGSSTGERARAAGCDWGQVAENLALGPDSARATVALWDTSSGHRATMLGSGYRRFGLGRAGAVWVLLVADGC